jgi:hypothetical protein
MVERPLCGDAINLTQIFTVEGDGHEGPGGEHRYASTLYLTSKLYGGGWSTPRPGHCAAGSDAVPIVQQDGWPPGPVMDSLTYLLTY